MQAARTIARRWSLRALAVVLMAFVARPALAKDPAQIRAEIERSRIENKRKADEAKRKSDEFRKKVQSEIDASRARMGLPPSSAAGAGSRDAGSSPVAGRRPGGAGAAFDDSRVLYNPRRGREYVFDIGLRIETGEPTRWLGRLYCLTVFDGGEKSRSTSAELITVGKLLCEQQIGGKGSWVRQPDRDIEFPRRMRFGSYGVLDTKRASFFDPVHVLPLQLSALLPVEELIFPKLPMFGDSPNNETVSKDTYSLRTNGGSSPFAGAILPKTEELKGETYRLTKIVGETSSQPTVINKESFDCPDRGIRLAVSRKSTFDATEGMVLDTDLDYTLKWEGESKLIGRARRVRGDLSAFRALAQKEYPVEEWPKELRRVQVDADKVALRQANSSADFSPGQAIVFDERHSSGGFSGNRCYAARVEEIRTTRDVRVRLEGSGEEMTVPYTQLGWRK